VPFSVSSCGGETFWKSGYRLPHTREWSRNYIDTKHAISTLCALLRARFLTRLAHPNLAKHRSVVDNSELIDMAYTL
jgi:hypothetical protein